MTALVSFTRAQLYVLVQALELDLLALLQKYVVDEIGEEGALETFLEKCEARRRKENSLDDKLSAFLDLQEFCDLLNRHRRYLPAEVAGEIRTLTPNIAKLVPVRNRLMHPRPLKEGDAELVALTLRQFSSRWWFQLQNQFAQFDQNPTFEPVVTYRDSRDRVLNNLPPADYDETGLIGRRVERDDLLKILKVRREPVVTIVGEGGVGKTALALEVAYAIVDDSTFDYEVVMWTSLKHERLTSYGVQEISDSIRDIAGVGRALGAVLDKDFQGPLHELASALDGVRALLVIDNLETFSGSEFRQIYDTLPASVTYLLTSREGVGELELRFNLSGLSEADASHLLSQMIRMRRVTTLSQISTEQRKSLVNRLRRSPLAIKWFVLAVEHGSEPESVLANQSELLKFCVESVFTRLSSSARLVVDSLFCLDASLSPQELMLILELSQDEVSRSLKELSKSSLITYVANAQGSEVEYKASLTESAQEFLKSFVPAEAIRADDVRQRFAEIAYIEESRQLRMGERPLGPNSVFSRGSRDRPVATVLDAALRASHQGNIEQALKDIERAREMDGEFFEVFRVEGLICAIAGRDAQASRAYEAAYQMSSGLDRARVAYFFAKFAARNQRDLHRGIQLAQEAFEAFETDDAALQLGTILVWSQEFEAAIPLLERAASACLGRQGVIAITTLADAYRRWGENAWRASRNRQEQLNLAKKGFYLTCGELKRGVYDRKLLDVAVDCAVESLRASADLVALSSMEGEVAQLCADIEEWASKFQVSSKWQLLLSAARHLSLSVKSDSPLSHSVNRIIDQVDQGTQSAMDNLVVEPLQGSALKGVVHSVKTGFGFISHPAFPDNIFFPFSNCATDVSIDELRPGSRVEFLLDVGDRGPVALNVRLALGVEDFEQL